MTEHKHTPGPWDVDVRDEQTIIAGKTFIAEVYRGTGATKANARLIAAAPDMLAALENLENDDASIPFHAWNMVQKAIAKAKGEV